MDVTSGILFFITGLLFLGMAFIFFKSTDGYLRKAMIYCFVSVGYNFIGRSITSLMVHEWYDAHWFLVNSIIVIPSLISGAFGFFYLYYKFYLKDKNLDNHIKNYSKKSIK